jgi:hypothetical protein
LCPSQYIKTNSSSLTNPVKKFLYWEINICPRGCFADYGGGCRGHREEPDRCSRTPLRQKIDRLREAAAGDL